MRFIWLIALMVIGGCSSLFPPEPLTGDYEDVLVIGHRGAAGLAPENTLVAIQTAIDLGVCAFSIRSSVSWQASGLTKQLALLFLNA